MCAYRHLSLSLSVCVSLHTLPSWLPLSCLAWLKIMDASLSKILNNAKVLAMEIDARFRAATWLMGIQTGIIPIPRTTTAASALGVFSFTGWASATGTGHDCPLWNVGMCRDVSGCVGMCMFHWRTWSLLETTGPESTWINCCVDRFYFHRKPGGDCKSYLSLCRTVMSPLAVGILIYRTCCIILL